MELADRSWKILDAIQAQIRAFDTKAQIVIGIDGILAGFFGSSILKLGELSADGAAGQWLVAAIILTAAAIIISVGFAVLTIHPRLDLGQPNSRIFFAHIFNEFGKNYADARKVLASTDDNDFTSDVQNQILANSTVCSVKARSFKFALFAMGLAYLFWILTLTIELRIARTGGTTAQPQIIYVDVASPYPQPQKSGDVTKTPQRQARHAR